MASIAPTNFATASFQKKSNSNSAIHSRSIRIQTQFSSQKNAILQSNAKFGALNSRRHVHKISAVGMDAESEIDMLTKMLELAKARKTLDIASTTPGDADEYDGGAFNIQTFNAISPVGLNKYPKGKYKIAEDVSKFDNHPMAIMLRSHKLQVEEVLPTVRCIARCGAGTNNIPVAKMTELGIPVFNTPGANANAVKELVICSLLLASRGIVEGHNHVDNVINVEENNDYEKISKRIEKDKSMFVGQEITGKTLGVIGLGQIGARVVDAALALGMHVVGYDPVLSVDAALMLPGSRMDNVDSLDALLKVSDYITIHSPYIPGVTHHMLNAATLKTCKPNVHILNFARGEIVDGASVKAMYDAGSLTGKYISDFSDPDLMGHPRHIVLPHLGASTGEAEENSAAMAADTIMSFLETGSIKNSVNFPTVNLKRSTDAGIAARLCIVNKNEAGVLGDITSFLGDQNINIAQQINVSRGDIAYTVIDMDSVPTNPDQTQLELQEACPQVISSRWIADPFHTELGKPGTYFQVSWDNL
mmetsp:Transcript_30792/g.42649  ORF Transcript_30792/g.42649 Transcript_30792/m.42649 type:complete len:533 (-) Transcript_30792:106-1704(-)